MDPVWKLDPRGDAYTDLKTSRGRLAPMGTGRRALDTKAEQRLVMDRN